VEGVFIFILIDVVGGVVIDGLGTPDEVEGGV